MRTIQNDIIEPNNDSPSDQDNYKGPQYNNPRSKTGIKHSPLCFGVKVHRLMVNTSL